MREYEQRLWDAINTKDQTVAPHLRRVHKDDLVLVLKRVERLSRQLENAKQRLDKKKALQK